MCGRFALHAANVQEEVEGNYPFLLPQAFQARNQPEFHPRYNVAPRSFAPVVRRRGPDAQEEGVNHQGEMPANNQQARIPVILQTMRWGVVPHWQKKDEGELKTINARSEVLLESESGIWASIKGSKRCIVPINGYYEWMKKGSHRIPYYVKQDSKLTMVAGLWDTVLLEGATDPLYTFTIVTTCANKALSHIHDRMPVFLSSREDIDAWLDPSKGWIPEVTKVLKPFEPPVDFYPVPTEVGKVGTNDPSFVLPVSHRKDGIEAMFKKQVISAKSETPSPVKAPATSQKPEGRKAMKLFRSETPEEKEPASPSVTLTVPDTNAPVPPTKIAESPSPSKVRSARVEKTKKRPASPKPSDGPTSRSSAEKRGSESSDDDIQEIEGPVVKPSKGKSDSPSPVRKKQKSEPSASTRGSSPNRLSSQATSSPVRKKKAQTSKPSKKQKPKTKITDFFART